MRRKPILLALIFSAFFVLNLPGASSAPPSLVAPVLSASATGTEVSLTWTDAGGETSFHVMRLPPNGFTWTEIAQLRANTLQYKDSGLSPSTTYHYVMVATRGWKQMNSNAVQVTTGVTPSLAPSPSPSPSPSLSPSPSPSPSPSLSPSPSPSPSPPGGSYPPPSTESSFGRFRVECELSHRAQVDPIVKPGPRGTLSGHMHDFFGNRSVDSDSTYGSMLAAGTTCGLSADTAGYWVPSLVTHDGAFVEPDRMIIYYRNRPIDYGTTIPFPPDFRMIAGGVGTYPHAYWTCEGQSDSSLSTRAQTPPDCGTERLKLHVFFPSCWDGVNIDSTNHRTHVAYAFDESDGTSTDISDDMCPASHPVKIPQVHIRVIFPVSNGPQYELADHTLSPHADFWNTWNQGELEGWVDRCLHAGIGCELAAD